ncbi:hypothetical protein METHPM2_170066 [Pseudomonas sp. PM2]
MVSGVCGVFAESLKFANTCRSELAREKRIDDTGNLIALRYRSRLSRASSLLQWFQ